VCLIGARGINGILAAFTGEEQASQLPDGRASNMRRARATIWRGVLLALLVIGFAVTIVRFHTRTVQLAADWLRGERARRPASGFMSA